MKRVVVGLCVLLLAAPAGAGMIDKKSGFNLALDGFHRAYSEDLQRPLKSDEDGWLLGGVLGIELNSWHNIHATLDVDYADWDTDYDGSSQSQDGTISPARGTTDNTFFTVESDIGYIFDDLPLPKSATAPFAVFGYKRWDRNIRVEDSFLDEDYDWWYIGLGVKTVAEPWEGFTAGLSFKAMRMIEGQIQIRNRLIAGSPPKLDLGDRWHFEVELPLTVELAKNVDFLFAPYYRREEIGRSNTTTVNFITHYDERTGELSTEPRDYGEPRSNTDYWGWRVGIVVWFGG